ncbi:OmpH family outer membrane protein [Dysgonomonas sp. 216]|uniref:OmpH family outer membrane protein n=1 Tax=Dysgonomonas sp. 216 TaxID=2302934 RepID=UPI0013D736D2|nr:OmpH family outer membrane protein [Dysgonomonas sp. 216]NDW19851.1 OmpH family outer membrane protein [Dysgonomonas sp. 216]
MLKKLIILLFVVAPIGAFAQNKLGYINSEETIMQMPELKDIESKLAGKNEEIKKNIASMEAEYNARVKEFQETNTDSLTQSTILDRQKQLEQIQERYENYVQNSNKEFGELRQQLLTPLQQKFQKALKEVGDEQGFTYIMEAGALPYVSTTAIDAAPFVKAKLGIK